MKRYKVTTKYSTMVDGIPNNNFSFVVLSKLTPDELKNKLTNIGELFYNLNASYEILLEHNNYYINSGTHEAALDLISRELKTLQIKDINMRALKSGIKSVVELNEELPLIE